jgi:hypothetical protein
LEDEVVHWVLVVGGVIFLSHSIFQQTHQQPSFPHHFLPL